VGRGRDGQGYLSLRTGLLRVVDTFHNANEGRVMGLKWCRQTEKGEGQDRTRARNFVDLSAAPNQESNRKVGKKRRHSSDVNPFPIFNWEPVDRNSEKTVGSARRGENVRVNEGETTTRGENSY